MSHGHDHTQGHISTQLYMPHAACISRRVLTRKNVIFNIIAKSQAVAVAAVFLFSYPAFMTNFLGS